MNYSLRYKLAIATSAIFLTACSSNEIAISVNNSLDIDRNGEMIEVDAKQIIKRISRDFIVRDEANREIPYQITYDSLLIFQVNVAAHSSASYNIENGIPAKVDTIATATYRPDCQDDLAWENDHAGYRLYGPIFRNTGGQVYGYDIWTKSVSYPLLNRRYDDDHIRGISYHVNHGDGFDGYTVGPTLGGGMNALVDANGEICYPCAYRSYELLDNGPLRMTVRFTIDTLMVDNSPVVETRTVTLDAGAWLNRTDTKYEGLKCATTIASGIVVHTDNTDYTLNDTKNFISYADQTDNVSSENGEIFVGLLAKSADSLTYKPFDKIVANAVGQILLYNTYQPGDTYTYYWGSEWSKAGVPDITDWNSILGQVSSCINHPLTVKLN